MSYVLGEQDVPYVYTIEEMVQRAARGGGAVHADRPADGFSRWGESGGGDGFGVSQGPWERANSIEALRARQVHEAALEDAGPVPGSYRDRRGEYLKQQAMAEPDLGRAFRRYVDFDQDAAVQWAMSRARAGGRPGLLFDVTRPMFDGEVQPDSPSSWDPGPEVDGRGRPGSTWH